MSHTRSSTQLEVELKPTPRAVFQAILDHKRQHDGNSPSVREISQAAGVKSTSQVMLELKRLEMLGLITVGRGTRNISVRGGHWNV